MGFNLVFKGLIQIITILHNDDPIEIETSWSLFIIIIISCVLGLLLKIVVIYQCTE
jgi:uncharacterized membrane protein HdeD (DUF308 family)